MTVPVTPLHHAGDKAAGTQVTPRRSAVSGVFILSRTSGEPSSR
ncbi:hypothetical protein [Klebsiella pneumoniae]|nr:hypothetical protein [Klebsiella pneumoniae]WMW13974.1 hypothetical protein NW906_29055 [Klebsiella pneumoniae]